MDFWYFAGLFFLTFLSEDAAVLSGGFLASMDMMAGPPAFVACFLGIWAGDIGLYLIARHFGRPLVNRFWATSERTRQKLSRSEAWFRRHGLLALILCRIVPGTRLPTYLTAGFLRMAMPFYIAVTGILAAAWVAFSFWLVHLLGRAAPGLFQTIHQNAAWVGLLVLILSILISLRSMIAGWIRGLRCFRRLAQWEFWPAWIFYIPVALKYLALSLKYRGLNLPTCANPGMFTGGLIGESKFATLRDLQQTSPEWVAASFLIDEGSERIAKFETVLDCGELDFPLVLKPDVAQRGSGFKVVRSRAQALDYLASVPVSVVAQAYIPGPHEIGVFYYRFPDEPCGRIFAITEKIFPVIVGDGSRSVEELIRADQRAAILADTYLRRFHSQRDTVLSAGISLRLVEAGNHAQGCIFRDGMHIWSEQLEARIDEISRKVPGFFVGRYDLRFASLAELRDGRGFSILELNGASSEATSAYDAAKTLGEAYRLLFQQWEIVFAIADANRRLGHRPDSAACVFAEWRRYQARSLCHPHAD